MASEEAQTNSENKKMRFYLLNLLGDSVQVRILEILLKAHLNEQNSEKQLWFNFSDISKQAGVAKSSGRRILDSFIEQNFIEEKHIETHAQNPPRMVRLNPAHPAINELIFFYRKVRGFL